MNLMLPQFEKKNCFSEIGRYLSNPFTMYRMSLKIASMGHPARIELTFCVVMELQD